MTDQTASFSAPGRLAAGQAQGAKSTLPLPVTLYFLTVVIPMFFSAGPLEMTTLRVVLLVMVVPVTVRLLAGRYGRIIATDYLFFGYVLWAAVPLWANNPDRMVEFAGSTGIEFFGGYMLGRAYIRTPEAFEALTRLIILFLVLTLPFAVLEALTSRSPLRDVIGMVPGISTVLGGGGDMRMGLFRVALTFSHQIHYGLFASLAFSLTFVGLKGRIGNGRRYLATAVIALCAFLSLSSGALLAVALHLILIIWQTAFGKVRLRWHLLVAMLALAYVVIDLLSNRAPIQVFMTYATFSPHTAYYRSIIFDFGMQNIWANPIFGIGLNDWERPAWMHSGSVDNFWLLAGMRFGIPGFLLVAGGYLIGLVRVIRRDFSADPRLRQLRLGWVFTFLGMIFTLSTVALWGNLYSFVFFMFGAGMWLIAAQPAGTPVPAAGPPGRGRGVTTRHPVTSLPPVAAPAAAEALPKGPRYTRFPPAGPGRTARKGDRLLPEG